MLKDIDIVVPKRGAILGLVGENGAGKSTMMNILGGVLRRDAGELLLDGVAYDPGSVADADRAGIAMIHQELNLFLNMTIAENLYLTGAPGTRLGLLSYRNMNREARRHLKRVGLELSPRTVVSELSMGVRQLVEIAKALSRDARIVSSMSPRPRLPRTRRNTFSASSGSFRQRASRSSTSRTRSTTCSPSATMSPCCATGASSARRPLAR